MFNLLPLSEQVSIKKQYRLRRAIVFLGFLVASLAVAIIFLIPSYLLSIAKEREVASQLESTKKAASPQNKEDLSLALKEINQKIQALKTGKNIPVAEFFEAILSHKSSSIKIIRLILSHAASPDGEVSITGIAKDRETLVLFAKELRLDSHFKDAILPPSNLAKDKDIEFSITLPLKS